MTDALKYVVIWGAGALGEHVHYLLSYDSNIHVRAFLDSNPEQVGKLFHGLPVLAATKESLLTLKNEGATHGI
jgi:FlaA1/EpsC-like NDP-sugar epimerase